MTAINQLANTNQITVLIPTNNNIRQLPDLLNDVSWADEILIVDSFSNDGTVEFARAHNIKVIQHQYVNSATQKNWAIPQCRYPWVLVIDTDERLTEELQQEIRQLLETSINPDVDAFRIARKTIFLGEWLKVINLWPDFQVRLFRRDTGRYENKKVHADVVVPGRVQTLEHPLEHNSTPSLSKQISLLDRYSTYQAEELVAQGVRFRWINLLIRPLAVFFYCYFLKGGFRAGFRGLFIAYHTMTFVFFTHAKLWEKAWQNQGEKRESR